MSNTIWGTDNIIAGKRSVAGNYKVFVGSVCFRLLRHRRVSKSQRLLAYSPLVFGPVLAEKVNSSHFIITFIQHGKTIYKQIQVGTKPVFISKLHPDFLPYLQTEQHDVKNHGFTVHFESGHGERSVCHAYKKCCFGELFCCTSLGIEKNPSIMHRRVLPLLYYLSAS